ncbi:alpha/beta hydrolase [Paucibacter sp. APW11]|uniref:Alpha/beta hydrolase n=1 Tax=Roseateles aquae TaxID=3077235 RepID=A0ABU3PDE2_9BURK|nr:alpha/beta hydrolase [Paucibacter sp. APW11]MDT9000342.1 alpha/beta hydrolase [Paucibacter sp. APW11]
MPRLTPHFPGLLRASTLLLATLTLSACVSVQVNEREIFSRNTAPAAEDWLSQAQAQAGATGARLEQVRFQSADGTSLGGLFLRQPGARLTAVYFQGAGNIVQRSYPVLLRDASQLPVNVLFWDYRGMGLSEGVGSMQQLRDDTQAAVREARRLSGDNLPLAYWGFSLGTLVGAHLAAEAPPDALLLEGTLTSAQDWADNKVPWYAKPFVRIQIDDSVRGYDNRQALQKLRTPTLLLVGSEDQTSPPAFTRSLAQAMQYRGSCLRVLEVPGVAHGGTLRKPEGVAAARELLERGAQRQGC